MHFATENDTASVVKVICRDPKAETQDESDKSKGLCEPTDLLEKVS